MNANKAIELGFADGVLADEKRSNAQPEDIVTYAFSRRAVTNSLLDKLKPKAKPNPAPTGVTAESRQLGLSLILH
jgi:ATP-dependent Clp protease protease subunit